MPIIYDLIFLVFCVLYLPYFLLAKKFHKGLWQRFGFYPAGIKNPGDRPIWLHAVSVGEVAAIRVFWETLRKEFPGRRIVVSTVTRTGNELARKIAQGNEEVFYLPMDFSVIVNSLLDNLRPKALIIAETEIWPNLISSCYKRGIPVLIINGRVSDRAFRRYSLVRRALRPVLRKISLFCARSEKDKERFAFLGAPAESVKVTGNLKFCAVPDKKAVDIERIKKGLGVGKNKLILMAGSTHKGEEKAVLEVYGNLIKKVPNLHLVIAPRHVERAAGIKKIASAPGITVIDKIGILKDLYAVSDVVFVGGSLVRHGGHNIIEPAVFAKPIIFGPHMFNFKDVAREFLKANAAVLVEDGGQLETRCLRLLSDEKERARLGENARRVVLNNQGAVENCIMEIKGILRDA